MVHSFLDLVRVLPGYAADALATPWPFLIVAVGTGAVVEALRYRRRRGSRP